MKQDWKLYFSFSRKELKGIVVIGCIILMSLILKFIFPKEQGNRFSKESNSSISKSTNLFPFDPNNVDSAQALQLGFTSKQFTTLKRYRDKGGSFKEAEDITKLYGLQKELVARLIPYVKIQTTKKPRSTYLPKNYKYWEGLGIFTKKQIWEILAMQKKRKGELGWKELVIKFDLTKEEAVVLQRQVPIKRAEKLDF